MCCDDGWFWVDGKLWDCLFYGIIGNEKVGLVYWDISGLYYWENFWILWKY